MAPTGRARSRVTESASSSSILSFREPIRPRGPLGRTRRSRNSGPRIRTGSRAAFARLRALAGLVTVPTRSENPCGEASVCFAPVVDGCPPIDVARPAGPCWDLCALGCWSRTSGCRRISVQTHELNGEPSTRACTLFLVQRRALGGNAFFSRLSRSRRPARRRRSVVGCRVGRACRWRARRAAELPEMNSGRPPARRGRRGRTVAAVTLIAQRRTCTAVFSAAPQCPYRARRRHDSAAWIRSYHGRGPIHDAHCASGSRPDRARMLRERRPEATL